MRLFPASPDQAQPVLDGFCFEGTYTTILRLEAHGLSRALFRNQPGRLSLAFAESGLCRGRAAGRPFRAIPNRFTCLLMPDEVLDLQVSSPRLVGFVIQISVEMLIQECALHRIDNPAPETLLDTIPGHESLLLACARQLLELRDQPESVAKARMVLPLEASILSLLASLVSSAKTDTSLNEPLAPQAIHVQNALGFFESHLGDSINLTDLCRACNVSARTLQVAFQTVMQQSPLQVLQDMRLTRLNQLLRQRVAVSQACDQVGLQPSGRMAANYKRLFGELPSETRRLGGLSR